MNHQEPRQIEEIQKNWISGHLYYHDSLDRVILDFVHPLVADLVVEGQVEAFFFVRYSLGGPHIRLRLRVVPGAREQALTMMGQAARNFLKEAPSMSTLDKEIIRRLNDSLLAGDPNESDNSVYPDNHYRATSFHPEIERYGGRSYFLSSLDFFTISSAAAIEYISQYKNSTRSVQLARVFCVLLTQALGSASDESELLDFTRYGVDSWGAILSKAVEKGDKVAMSRMAAFLELGSDCLENVRSLLLGIMPPQFALGFLALGASRLSAAIKGADRTTRARIGGSHMHMTATRLGLSHPEEVYVSRLLTLTVSEMCAANRQIFSWLGEETIQPAIEDPYKGLGQLIRPTLLILAKSRANHPAPNAWQHEGQGDVRG